MLDILRRKKRQDIDTDSCGRKKDRLSCQVGADSSQSRVIHTLYLNQGWKTMGIPNCTLFSLAILFAK